MEPSAVIKGINMSGIVSYSWIAYDYNSGVVFASRITTPSSTGNTWIDGAPNAASGRFFTIQVDITYTNGVKKI